MKKQILSKVASNAAHFLFTEKPSEVVPFSGNFPILPAYKYDKWREEFENNFWLEDCSEWFQETVRRATKMETVDSGFTQFLIELNLLNNFNELNNSKKADLLMKYLNANSMTLEHLNISPMPEII